MADSTARFIITGAALEMSPPPPFSAASVRPSCVAMSALHWDETATLVSCSRSIQSLSLRLSEPLMSMRCRELRSSRTRSITLLPRTDLYVSADIAPLPNKLVSWLKICDGVPKPGKIRLGRVVRDDRLGVGGAAAHAADLHEKRRSAHRIDLFGADVIERIDQLACP